MQVHYTDEVYRAHDGVRDPLRWSRFTTGKFLAGAMLIAFVTVWLAGREPQAQVAGLGLEVGSHVAATAVRMSIAIAESEAP